MKPRVLITSVGKKVSLVKSFKAAGWSVYGMDADPLASALKFCDDYFVYPEWNIDGDYVPLEYAKKIKAKLIVPTRDAELLTWSGLYQKIKVLCPSKETVENCVDKFKFYKFCRANGFRTPEVYFVKPRVSSSGKKTEVLWQELVEGEEYSVDLFADFHGNVISIVPRKRVKIVDGESWVGQTVDSRIILDQSKRLAEELGLIGHNVLQCFLSQEIPVWTDVNCRFGGGSALGIKAGCRSPEFLMSLCSGKEVSPRIGDYRVGLSSYRFTDDVFVESKDER